MAEIRMRLVGQRRYDDEAGIQRVLIHELLEQKSLRAGLIH